MNGKGSNQPLAAGRDGVRPLEAAKRSSGPALTVFTVTGAFSSSLDSASGIVFSTTSRPMVMRSVAIENAVQLRATL